MYTLVRERGVFTCLPDTNKISLSIYLQLQCWQKHITLYCNTIWFSSFISPHFKIQPIKKIPLITTTQRSRKVLFSYKRVKWIESRGSDPGKAVLEWGNFTKRNFKFNIEGKGMTENVKCPESTQNEHGIWKLVYIFKVFCIWSFFERTEFFGRQDKLCPLTVNY